MGNSPSSGSGSGVVMKTGILGHFFWEIPLESPLSPYNCMFFIKIHLFIVFFSSSLASLSPFSTPSICKSEIHLLSSVKNSIKPRERWSLGSNYTMQLCWKLNSNIACQWIVEIIVPPKAPVLLTQNRWSWR